MNIVLYSGFDKKMNSTKRPGEGVSYITLTGTLKDPCSVMSPVIRIKRTATDFVPCNYTYAYIAKFNRYYFVSDVRWSEGFWEISMNEDILASYKVPIGNSTQYILRTDSTTDYNQMITDVEYPATNDTTLFQYNIQSGFVNDPQLGFYIVGIISGDNAAAVGAITYYAMTDAEFGDLKAALLNENNLVTMGLAILDPGTGDLIPQITDMSLEVLKTMYNPFQYIASCMWFPISGGFTGYPVSKIRIGWWEYNLGGMKIPAQTVDVFEGPTNIVHHPQAATRGDYLNYSPYTRCTLYGIFGTLPLDLSYFDKDDDQVNLTYIIDLITGQCRVRVESINSTTHFFHYIAETSFLIGVPIQLAQIATDYLGTAVAAVDATGSTLSSFAKLDFGGAISNAAHGIYNTLNASMPQLQTSGNNGSFMITDQYLPTTFVYQFRNLVDEDIVHKGRPLCENRTINTLSGYILCADGEMDLDCLESERSAIADYLTSGFFWE